MTRLKRRLSLNKIKENALLPTLKRSSKISVVLSLVGMFVTLLGAEQIVGTLASKANIILLSSIISNNYNKSYYGYITYA